MVMCTMGGVPGDFSFMPKLAEVKDVLFVLAGLEPLSPPPPNVRAIPHTSNLYHPDLVAAADAVVGKVGYSTVAEAYYGRTQFLYIPRPRFPESRVMEAFVSRELNGIEIPQSDFETGSWASHVKELLTPPPQKDISPDQTAGSLLRALESILHTHPAA
jgi:UDP-N-acetylglucosamine:LPS N-acetylglucosamine transferase